jgi:hypothetical protein
MARVSKSQRCLDAMRAIGIPDDALDPDKWPEVACGGCHVTASEIKRTTGQGYYQHLESCPAVRRLGAQR